MVGVNSQLFSDGANGSPGHDDYVTHEQSPVIATGESTLTMTPTHLRSPPN